MNMEIKIKNIWTASLTAAEQCLDTTEGNIHLGTKYYVRICIQQTLLTVLQQTETCDHSKSIKQHKIKLDVTHCYSTVKNNSAKHLISFWILATS